MRVLHLIDPATPGGGAYALHLLGEVTRRVQSVHHDVVIIGTRTHQRLAEQCGVEARGHLSIPLNVPVAGRRALRRLIDAFEQTHGPYDLIHAWTLRSATLATLATPEARRLATFNIGPVTDANARLFIMLHEQHPMPLLASSVAVGREYLHLGVDDHEVAVLRPAINPDGAAMLDREPVRSAWGVPDDALVVGLPAEPASWADARVAADMLVRAAAAGRTVRLVAHPAAARLDEARSWLHALDLPELLIIEEDLALPWRVLNGLDAALLIGGGQNADDLSASGSAFSLLLGGGRRLRPMPGVAPLLWAMAAGVPVVAEASDAVRDAVPEPTDGEPAALLVQRGDLNAACNRILRLCDDPTLRGRIGAAARRHVRDDFHISTYCLRLQEAYGLLRENRSLRSISGWPHSVVERYEPNATDRVEVGG